MITEGRPFLFVMHRITPYLGHFFVSFAVIVLLCGCVHTTPDKSLKDRGKYYVHKGTGSPILTSIKDWELVEKSVVDNLTPDIGVALSYRSKEDKDDSPVITLFIVYRKTKTDPKQVVETRMHGSIPHMKLNRTETLTLPNNSTVDAEVFSYLGYISIPFVGSYLPIAPEEGDELESYLIQDPRLTNRIYWIQTSKANKDRDMQSVLKFIQQYINSTKKKPAPSPVTTTLGSS